MDDGLRVEASLLAAAGILMTYPMGQPGCGKPPIEAFDGRLVGGPEPPHHNGHDAALAGELPEARSSRR
ncbi:MAG: hypothetical protein E6I81_10455 [Chloroflexi bacterium]|nr:MAG: hypothetical protein E6I81_10455 [Chloroflexota bacterium]